MLGALVRHARAAAPRVEAVAAARRGMALKGMKGYDDKESAAEAAFMHAEDEKALKRLLGKVRAQVAAADGGAAHAADLKALDALVGGRLGAAEKEALIKWKHEH